MDIENDPKFKYFLSQREIAHKTRLKYIGDLKKYCEFTGLTPTELIQQARMEQKEFEFEDERQITTHLSDFKTYLQDEGISKYSIKNILVTIKTFYNQFKIETPSVTVKNAHPSTYYLTIEDLPSYDDLSIFINNASLNYQAIFMTLASSGMNISDLFNLKVSDFIKAVQYHHPEINTLQDLFNLKIDDNGIVPVWKLPRTKTGEPRITFTSPESFKHTLRYLKSHPPMGEDDPLFRGRIKGKKLQYDTISRYMGRLNKKIGWENKKIGYYNYITTKTFRTYFANTLEEYGVQEKFIRAMMGHRQVGVRQFYHKLNTGLLLREYAKALPGLTFVEGVQVVNTTDKELLKLREEREKDREELKQLRKDLDRALGIKQMEDDLKNNRN